jgi:diguanylate cyclase (GGDEF)-like protein/PAS domain S-box-containing protein
MMSNESCRMVGSMTEWDRLALWSLDHSPDGILWADIDGVILFANHALHTMTGYGEDDLVGMSLLDIDMTTKPTDIGEEGILTKLIQSGSVTNMSSAYRRKDDYTFPVEIAVSLSDIPDVRFVCFIQDVSERLMLEARLDECISARRREKRELLKTASTDHLTGTWLRRRFFEVAGDMTTKANVGGEYLSLLMIDVDHFKVINDRLGHNVGDQVLRQVVDIIVAGIRVDDFLVRWGGDEFVLLMPGMDVEAATRVAQRLQTDVAAHRFGPDLVSTVSIGVSQYVPGEDVIESWVARADAAMYRAKASGRNAVCR